jgi:hypothetical protein
MIEIIKEGKFIIKVLSLKNLSVKFEMYIKDNNTINIPKLFINKSPNGKIKYNIIKKIKIELYKIKIIYVSNILSKFIKFSVFLIIYNVLYNYNFVIKFSN